MVSIQSFKTQDHAKLRPLTAAVKCPTGPCFFLAENTQCLLQQAIVPMLHDLLTAVASLQKEQAPGNEFKQCHTYSYTSCRGSVADVKEDFRRLHGAHVSIEFLAICRWALWSNLSRTTKRDPLSMVSIL